MINVELQIIINAVNKGDDLQKLLEYDESIFEQPDTRKLYNLLKQLNYDREKIDLTTVLTKLQTEKIKLGDQAIDGLLRGTTAVNYDYLLRALENRDRGKTIMALSRDIYQSVKDGAPYNEFLEKLYEIESTKKGRDFVLTHISKLDNDIDNIFHRINYIRTGITHLDEKINGLFNGQLIVIGGRPGEGKTTLALNIMLNVKSAIMFSIEMKFPELYSKMLSAKTNVESWRIEAKKLNDIEKEKVLKAHLELKDKTNITIYDKDLNINNIRAIMRRDHHKYKLFIIDYLQLIPGGIEGNRNDIITDMTKSLKNIAHDINKPIILLSQLNRTGQKERREPELHDLRDSGSIEQDADLVLFCHNTDDNFNLIIGKNRKGRSGIIKGIQFVKQYSRFDDEIEIQ